MQLTMLDTATRVRVCMQAAREHCWTLMFVAAHALGCSLVLGSLGCRLSLATTVCVGAWLCSKAGFGADTLCAVICPGMWGFCVAGLLSLDTLLLGRGRISFVAGLGGGTSSAALAEAVLVWATLVVVTLAGSWL